MTPIVLEITHSPKRSLNTAHSNAVITCSVVSSKPLVSLISLGCLMALLLMSNCRPTHDYGAFFTIYGFLAYAGRFLRHSGANLNLYFEILRLLTDAHGGSPEASGFLPSYLLHNPHQPISTSSQLQSFLEVYFQRKVIPWPGTHTGYWLAEFLDGIADFFDRVRVPHSLKLCRNPDLTFCLHLDQRRILMFECLPK